MNSRTAMLSNMALRQTMTLQMAVRWKIVIVHVASETGNAHQLTAVRQNNDTVKRLVMENM